MIGQCCTKDCPGRKPACHDKCEKYREWKQELEKEKEYTRKKLDADQIHRNDYEKEGWMARKGQRKRRQK